MLSEPDFDIGNTGGTSLREVDGYFRAIDGIFFSSVTLPFLELLASFSLSLYLFVFLSLCLLPFSLFHFLCYVLHRLGTKAFISLQVFAVEEVLALPPFSAIAV
jgi:hypothetical protein